MGGRILYIFGGGGVLFIVYIDITALMAVVLQDQAKEVMSSAL